MENLPRQALERTFEYYWQEIERRKTGDPRKSIAERYSGREDYLARYSKSLDELIKQRWILPEDREALLHRGDQEWEYASNDGNAN